MKKFSRRWVTDDITPDNQAQRVEQATALLQALKED
jgi:hypothetical protein